MAARYKYKGITFAEGYNKTFDQFVKEFEETHVFKNMPPEKRKAAMKEAHNGIISLNKLEAKNEEKEKKEEANN